MKRGDWAEQPELLLANSRNSIIRVQRLEELGVPSYTTYRRCSPEGPWRRVLPGVVCLHNGSPTRLQEVSAALLYGGDGAVVTGVESCRRHGLRNLGDDPTVHLLVPDTRQLHTSGHVVVERTTRMPDKVVKRGVPLAPVTRALLDASRRMATLPPCRALLAEAIQRRMTTWERLAWELAKGSRRGSAIPRKVLAELEAGAHSIAEINAQALWRRAGLPPAEWNGLLYGPDGAYLGSPDAYCDKVAFACEVDSVTHHGDPEGYAKTVARNARYAAAGVVVLQVLPSRMRDQPDEVIAELRAAYAAAQRRPRPPVRFVPRR